MINPNENVEMLKNLHPKIKRALVHPSTRLTDEVRDALFSRGVKLVFAKFLTPGMMYFDGQKDTT